MIKLKPSGDQFTYFLHYMGWNSRWDKWVVESDLMAAGPEALEMQKQLKEKQKKEKVSIPSPNRSDTLKFPVQCLEADAWVLLVATTTRLVLPLQLLKLLSPRPDHLIP